MNIFEICKIALHGCIAMAIVALLLLASPAALRADDNNKNKKKDSAQAKSAPNPKASTGSTSGKGSGSGSGAGSGATGNSGGTHNSTDSGGAQTTRHSGRTNSNTNTAGTSTSGNTGATSSTGNSSGTSSTGTSGGTNKERKAAARANSNTGGTSSTSNPGGTSSTGNSGGTSATGSSTHKERKTDASTGNTTGTTSTTGNTGQGKVDKSARKSAGAPKASGDLILSGGRDDATKGSSRIIRGSSGKVEVYRGHDGSEARFGRDGRVREVHARDMTIIHLPGGSRRIVVEREDHSRVVAYRGGYGYVQRPFAYRDHEFASRTYFYLGHPYARYYQRYPYRGLYLEGYRPYSYYRPAFYGWAYNPWGVPIRYTWGWVGNPWYGYYGGYFTPYTVYPSASFWLTDYFIAASLQQAYQQRIDNQAAYAANSGGPVVLTPEVKQAIANEVQGQLALENSESQAIAQGGDVDINSSGLPRILAEVSPSHPHIFVLAGPLEVTDVSGQECGLTAGDVLRLSAAPSPDSTSAFLEVFASKNQDCVRGTTVSVGLADLQEMQNHMRASIDQGLQELQDHQGGLPAPPRSAAAPAMAAPFAPIAPPADLNVSSELQQQAREADTAEQGVLNEAKQANDSSGAGDSSAPVEISLGQTTEEVVAALGKPSRVIILGSKKIYVYPDLKITFVNGKVTSVE
jgi:hypothetical protein